MEKIQEILNYSINITNEVSISVKIILIVIVVILLTSLLLNTIRKLVTKKLPKEDVAKFISVFDFAKWSIYVIILLMTLHNMGVNVTTVFAASAALLVGIGLALQTFFQDIISGIFIVIDQSVHVGDIIEINGKVGRVEDIKLRTTRAITIDNKVLVIPNHLYLTNTLYNWTENGSETRESVEVGVAYGSDVELVKKLLLAVADEHSSVLKTPAPLVLFTNFGDSALNFKLIFTLNDSFMASIPQSDMRFAIDKKFREHGISIPFPQRDVHIVAKKDN